MFLLRSILTIYTVAAVLPAAILMIFVYKQDKVESEPVGLIGSLLLRGVFAALLAMVLETILQELLPNFVSPANPYYMAFFAFIVVAMAEEGAKMFFMHRRVWRDVNFNYKFDAIVYAAAVSLGFAGFENILYVFGYGLSVAPSRAMLAIPGHLSFSVFMGIFYGRAKLFDNQGESSKCRLNMVLAYVASVFCHGVYDACLMLETVDALMVFVVFVIAMFITAFTTIKREAKTDVEI